MENFLTPFKKIYAIIAHIKNLLSIGKRAGVMGIYI